MSGESGVAALNGGRETTRVADRQSEQRRNERASVYSTQRRKDAMTRGGLGEFFLPFWRLPRLLNESIDNRFFVL